MTIPGKKLLAAPPHRQQRHAAPALLAAACCLLALAGITGCGGPKPAHSVSQTSPGTASRPERLGLVLDNLFALEQFESGESVEEILKRIAAAEEATSHQTLDPLALTWPEPTMLRQIGDRLAQWLREQQPPADWQRDPLLAALPEHLQQLPMVRAIESMELLYYDTFALMEIAWLRDCANWVCGEKTDQLGRALRLFDWTVRNIQLEAPGPLPLETPGGHHAHPDQPSPAHARHGNVVNSRVPLVPWEVLLCGRGTAWERAWLFILLARQQNISAAVLGIAGASPGSVPRPWAVGVLIDGQVYLFDPALGLPIPAPDGLELAPSGSLRIKPATLAQAAADDALLRQMDAGAGLPYPVTADDLARLVVLVEASPAALSRRFRLLQASLADKQGMRLAVSAKAEAEQWQKLPGVTAAALWLHPYHTLHQRLHLGPQQIRDRLLMLLPLFALEGAPLYKGRLLHLRGQLAGDENAVPYYLAARPSDQQLRELIDRTVKQFLESHSARLELLPAEQRQTAEKLITENGLKEARLRAHFIATGKQDATFWLACIAAEQGHFRTAADYLSFRAADTPGENPWTAASHYLMARLLEATGQNEAAANLYEDSATGVYRHGNLLRARWLRQLSKATKQQPDGK